MRACPRTLAIAVSTVLSLTSAASATDGLRSFKARFVETGPEGLRSAGTSLTEEGKELEIGGWSGGPGQFETSPGFSLKLTPTLRAGTMTLAVNGRLHDAYGDFGKGRRPIARSSFSAQVFAARQGDTWVYEQSGLPGGGTIRVTFSED